MIIGFYFFLGQFFEVIGDILALPAAMVKSIGMMLINASGYNDLFNNDDDGQE